MDINAPRISARGIGDQIGATSVEVNRLLKDQGILYGKPGGYGLTPKGEKFGIQQAHDNGYGGYAHRSWETTHFDPSITGALDSSPDRLAKVREDIVTHRHALSAARKVAQAEAEANFHVYQASKEPAKTEPGIDPQTVFLVIAGIVVMAVAGYVVYKGAQWGRRRKVVSAKGNLCPDCGTYTLQRISANWKQCTTCELKKPV